MKKGKKIIVLLIAMIISIINIGVVKADTKNIEVTNVTVKDKSGTITVADPVITYDEITSNVTFNKVDDFVTFELKIKNNESEKYKIESITDNNTNENISIDYVYDENFISKGETSTITIKLKYNKQLLNVEKVNLNDLTIKINFENEEGNSSEVVINPVTGDNILHYLVLLIISITGLIIIIKKKKKIGSILLVLPILLIPFITFAKEKYEVKINFTDIEIKGEFETYNIVIDPKNGETPVTKAITYGNSIGELSESPSKEGYTFDKWVDSDGNTVTEDTVITGPIEIEAKYKVKEYTITYNLDGGTVTGNPEKYTIESEDITLKNPSKEGYTFSGWTGTGIDTKTTSVTIENGSTGNRSYTANYSANEDTEYKVTHRYQNLDGTYTEVVVTEYGETDKEVEAPIKSKTGFVNPSVQRVTITSDGSASVTYTYVREIYAFSITDRTYIDSTSTADGNYPYETEINVKTIERAGYDFVWSDGETALERTFEIKEATTLTPVYTAKTNIPYKVVHQKQKITLDGYEIADTQNLTGTTDTSVTPAVNTYEGFTSPQTQTVTIKGDGSTVVTYNYDRIMYDFSTNNNEDVTSTKIDGRYPYGTEITLTAKEKQGYTFIKWSNDETSNPYTFILNSNLTIKPVYTSDGYTITLNANGGSINPTSITVNEGDAVGELPEPTPPTNKVFDGWYTELSEGTKVNAPYTPEGDITLYAHWNNNSFPEVFSEPGECTFNGSSGVLTGDNCSYANGTNKYIDTGINLYNHENHDKDYEIGFTIVSTNLSEQVRQATFMNTKLEGNNYPGLVFRRKTTTNDLDLSSRVTSSTNIQLFFDNTTTENVKIYRITNKETGIQEIFYSINDEEKVLLNDLSQFNPTFDLSVWFGASPADISATSAQRILKGTLKDMYIKLGTYQEDSNNYKITFNANGGSVTPASRKIDIGNEIGTLPIPTPPTGKEFIGWYTGLTDGEEVTSSYKPNSNKTIYARYTNISYIVSFNTNDGSTVASQTVNIGGKATRPTTNPTKNNYTFDNWYTDTSYNTLFDFENTIITKNTTIYAHFNDDQFPLVFNEPGECTFNGESGVITGEDCSFANGVNKYIDTGINLYNSTNKSKDYEIGFTIVNYNYVNQVSQATFMNSKQEASGYPGVVFRRKDIEAGYDLSSRNTSSQNARALFNYSDGIKKVKIYRITNEETGIQEIFYSINDSEKVLLNDLSQFNPTFDLSVWFGAAPTNSNATSAQRYLIGTMKDMYIKLGTYPEESDTDTYKITFNANGGSVTPSSKKINIGDEIGTLPTPTPPTGKTFDNWYTDLTGGIEVTSSYIPNNNITIYARYTDPCNGFSTDSWSTIRDNLENDSDYYAVGCEKEVELDMDNNGTNESYTVRLANTSTPEVCNTEGYSQTACGLVIEFVDLVASRQMNSTDTNEGGWKSTEMVSYLNNDLYNKLPSELQSVIIPTYPIVSGSGSGGVSDNIINNDTTKNKLYLLSGREVGSDLAFDNRKNTSTDTRILDYYEANNNDNARIKSGVHWWLRSAISNNFNNFYYVSRNGNYYITNISTTNGVAPAFRIGTMPKFTVSFDTDGGSTVASQTVNYGGVATRPTTDPTKTGYTFDDWYTDDTYTTKFDFDTPITSDTTIYAHFEDLKVCANNENITRLSENTCSNNENITIGDGIVCKRAVKLHEETCSQTQGTNNCSTAGYTISGSKGTSTITYGNCGTSGTLSSGDAFTCDVNGDGTFDELTERFYYVSDYYDTSTKIFDVSTAVLIYYNSLKDGVACNNYDASYSYGNNNYSGPTNAKLQLPTTDKWSNVSLKTSSRQILNQNGTVAAYNRTLPIFDYTGYAARFLTVQELNSACGVTIGNKIIGELDNCNYMVENTNYSNIHLLQGNWLETSYPSNVYNVWVIINRRVSRGAADNPYSVRPVIEVPKNKISY